VCATFDEMKRGEQQEVPLYALFTDQVLTITEGTKVAAEVEVSYTISGSDLSKAESRTLRLYDRNAMTWDDDRKASAFITAKDPAVLRFAKSTAGFIREHNNKAVNLSFRVGMGIFEALQLHGINYVVDPQTPYEEFSEDTDAIDYLQFPVHTMTYKAGDCDDLSILYCALLESAGIETAFITVPGHIFAAFNLGMAPEEAKKLFLNPGDLIYQEEETWVPVEITLIQEGFLRAWEKGASEWREFVPSGNARFYPVHEAWREYEPVGLPDPAAGLEFPADEQIAAAYTKAVTRFVEREIAEKVERYLARIESSNNNPKYINGLGVLYAKYGLLDKAEVRFEEAVRSQYVPAMINLGNVLFLQDNLEESLRYFAMARAERPESTQAMLGIAKAQYELENYTAVKETYSEIRRKDPDLAGRFAYLSGGSAPEGGETGSTAEQTARASAAMRRETVVWAEEEQ
jgi:tetratricopeptide (TPR) repeat protein